MSDRNYSHWHTNIDTDGILWIHMDVQGSSTNTFSRDVLVELGNILNEVESSVPKGIAFISDKYNGFIAGADIREFSRLSGRDDALLMIQFGQSIMDRIDALACPTVAVINGFCMGGGTELALACDYRIVEDKPTINIALPEVKLGIHPGFGGTMRAVRVLGPVAAMDMMLTGRNYDPARALSIGLVDKVVTQDSLKQAAKSLLKANPKPHQPAWYLKLLNTGVARPFVARQMRKQVARKANKNHYPAPYALIDLWEKYGGNERRMLAKEAESVADLSMTATARNLVHVFMLKEHMKSQADKSLFKPHHVHVIGAGTMGGDIAAWCALRGMQVSVQDTNAENLQKTRDRASGLFEKQLKKPELILEANDRLMTDSANDQIDDADIVIEAIVEDANAKSSLYRSIEPRLKHDAILATNTSSIPLETLAKALQNPERLTGLHFFNPVAAMPLLEIVHGSQTSEETVAKALAFSLHISKLPLNVKSAPGFLVNRILMPYMIEAAILAGEGIPESIIDAAAVNFGMPMGPIELADIVGLDVGLSVAKVLSDSYHFDIPDGLIRRVEQGKLGKKSGEGFYVYKDGKPQKSTASSTLADLSEIQDRLILRFLNETVACRQERIVDSDDLLDAGIVFGTGFAPFRGGPLRYIRETGKATLLAKLKRLEARYGDRFTPHSGWNEIT